MRHLGVGLRGWYRRLRSEVARLLYAHERATREHWEGSYATGQWERLRHLDQVARYSAIVGYCDYFKPGGSVLDVGCGEGVIRERLGRHGYSHYVGIDIAAEAICRASRAVDAKAQFFRANAESYVPDRQFDVMIFNECLYYVSDPVRIVERYLPYLREDGVVVISMYGVKRTKRVWQMLDGVWAAEDEVRVSLRSGRYWVVKVFTTGGVEARRVGEGEREAKGNAFWSMSASTGRGRR